MAICLGVTIRGGTSDPNPWSGRVPFSAQLLRLQLPVLPLDHCYQMSPTITPTQYRFCSANPDPQVRKGPCNGDSGGPILDKDDRIIGIHSLMPQPCGHPGAPNYHVNIGTIAAWIEHVTGLQGI